MMTVPYLETLAEDFDSQAQLTMDGLLRKEAGIRTVLIRHSEYRERVVEFVESLPPGTLVDAEMVRDECGDPPHPNALGACFSHMAKAGLIIKQGHRPSKRPQRHAAEIRVYRKT